MKYEGENTEENDTLSLTSSYFLLLGFFLSPVPGSRLFSLLFACFFFCLFVSVLKVRPSITFYVYQFLGWENPVFLSLSSLTNALVADLLK